MPRKRFEEVGKRPDRLKHPRGVKKRFSRDFVHSLYRGLLSVDQPSRYRPVHKWLNVLAVHPGAGAVRVRARSAIPVLLFHDVLSLCRLVCRKVKRRCGTLESGERSVPRVRMVFGTGAGVTGYRRLRDHRVDSRVIMRNVTVRGVIPKVWVWVRGRP